MKRLIWFGGLWLMGGAAVAGVSLLLRWWLAG